MRLARRGAFGSRSQGTLCISSNNDVSERVVGSSPPDCSRFQCAILCPNNVLPDPCCLAQCLLYGVSFSDDSPRCSGALLAEVCRSVVSTTTLSGILAFTFSATVMIVGSLSQCNLNFPTKHNFHEVSPLSLQGGLWLLLSSDAVARMQPVLESTIARGCPQIVIGFTVVGSGFSHCEFHCDDGPSRHVPTA